MASGLFWAAAFLALVFALNLLSRYRTRHAPFYLWWSFSFFLYVLTFVMEAVTVSGNYHLLEYQLYIIGSSGLVGFMSAGTGFLAFARRPATFYAGLITLLFLALTISVFAVAPSLRGDWLTLNRGAGITGLTQILYIVMVSVGGLVVFAGALWSWWKTRRHYNLLIAAGVLISGAAGTLASQGMGVAAFPFVNIIAVTLIFLGYIYSRPSVAVRAHPAPRPSREA